MIKSLEYFFRKTKFNIYPGKLPCKLEPQIVIPIKP